jgi:prevent-host-death family protein
MPTTKLSSREFNQDTGRAKRAAQKGPVIVTERGRPSHVLLTFESYEQLVGKGESIVHALGQPRGVEDIELEIPRMRDRARAADLR